MCIVTAAAIVSASQSCIAAGYKPIPESERVFTCCYCGTSGQPISSMNCKNCGAPFRQPKSLNRYVKVQEEAIERSRAGGDTKGINPMGERDIVPEGTDGTVFPRSSDIPRSDGDFSPSYDTGIPQSHVPYYQEESQTTGGSFGSTPDASPIIESPSPTTET
jgi:hypothetical protein